jgi:hypothetical protein
VLRARARLREALEPVGLMNSACTEQDLVTSPAMLYALAYASSSGPVARGDLFRMIPGGCSS